MCLHSSVPNSKSVLLRIIMPSKGPKLPIAVRVDWITCSGYLPLFVSRLLSMRDQFVKSTS